MVFKYISFLKNRERGITLVEIAVVLFIIALFFTIVIIGLPEIEKRFSLSRATYNLAQDLREARDLTLSGVGVKDADGSDINVAGYGIYINLDDPGRYVIYADISGNQKYSDGIQNYTLCSDYIIEGPGIPDCLVAIVNIKKENKSLYVKRINGTDPDGIVLNPTEVSINFLPPNPSIHMEENPSLGSGQIFDPVEIVLGLEDREEERTVFVNTSGLISIK